MEEGVKAYLFRKLKEENSFWSYDVSKMDAISDEALIEHVLLYHDIDDNHVTKTEEGSYVFKTSKGIHYDISLRTAFIFSPSLVR